MIDPDSIQHINLKVFIKDPEAFVVADAVAVFHRWIRDSLCPEMLIDVADYAHVPAGPGLLLIGHEANYSFDNRENRMGLLYNRKAPLEGTFQSRLEQAYRAALDACERLEQEPELVDKVRFDRDALEVFVNDRLLAPNNEETWQTVRPELEKFFVGYVVRRVGESRDLFRVSVTKP